MNSKTLSMTLASLISLQSVSFANTDRTQGIGEQAISDAKKNLGGIHHQILLLDQSLAQSAEAISARDSKGGVRNGFAIAGAGLGLGLTTMAFLATAKGGEGSMIGGLLFGAISIGATAFSLVPGVVSKVFKPEVNTSILEAQLTEIQKNVSTAIHEAGNDKTTSVILSQLNLAIKNTQESLAQYKTQDNAISRNKFIAQASQLVGVALMVYGVTQRQSQAPMIGSLVMSAGNLATIIYGLQGSQAETVLNEIRKTRESLKTVSAALQ